MTTSGTFYAKAEAAEKIIIAQAKHGLELSAGKVGAMAVEDTPIDTTNLRRSEYETDVEEINSSDFIIEVGYKADYAVPVHEITSNKHKRGHAKYLETALKEFSPKMLSTIKKEMKL